MRFRGSGYAATQRGQSKHKPHAVCHRRVVEWQFVLPEVARGRVSAHPLWFILLGFKCYTSLFQLVLRRPRRRGQHHNIEKGWKLC